MLIKIARIPIKEIILIGFLPFFIKRIIYWVKGYNFGKKVTIGIGSVIIGKNVTIGSHTKIGYFTIIRGNNIKIGSHVSNRLTTFLDTPNLEIGDNTIINEQVFIGGIELPESKLGVGKNCTIMQLTYINCANPVVIGDDTGIGGHCLIFTHSSWLSQFEGYPVKFGSNKRPLPTLRLFMLPRICQQNSKYNKFGAIAYPFLVQNSLSLQKNTVLLLSLIVLFLFYFSKVNNIKLDLRKVFYGTLAILIIG